MIIFFIIALIGHFEDADAGKPFHGILCHLKPKVSITCKGDEWINSHGQISDLICDNTPYHEAFPAYDKIGSYIDFKLNGFYVHPNKLKIKGRMYDDEHNMVDWSIQGIKSDGTTHTLIHNTEELMANKTITFDNPEKDKRILYSGFRIINNALDVYHTKPYGYECSHVCIATFDVFGALYENFFTKSQINHINFVFIAIFLEGKTSSSSFFTPFN